MACPDKEIVKPDAGLGQEARERLVEAGEPDGFAVCFREQRGVAWTDEKQPSNSAWKQMRSKIASASRSVASRIAKHGGS
jgi:hypothetical protein